jgi:Na+-transporting NADH:ubiquinone oxidoreductase subunit NqrB
MFLYVGDQLLPFVFAVLVAITSKAIFTVTIAGQPRHFLNPSNTGLVVTFVLFPMAGLLPYHFTEGLYGYGDWALPALIVCTGTFLNARFTNKIPLIISWLSAFTLQAVIRHFLFSASLPASLAQMSGVAFLLFTFYMITDPQTSPSNVRGQVIFGCSIGVAYGIFMAFHVLYTIFGALLAVCICRGVILYAGEFALVHKAKYPLSVYSDLVIRAVRGQVLPSDRR